MRWKRIILGAAVLVLVLGAGLVLAAVVLYQRPASVKALAERALSARLGAAVSIGSLEYGLRPAGVAVAEITLGAGPNASGLALHVSKLAAQFRLEGDFGDRTLWLSRLELSGVRLAAEAEGRWRETFAASGPPSWWGRIGWQVVSALWFRQLRFGTVTVSDADLTWNGKGLQAELHGISAESREAGIEVRGRAEARWPQTSSVLKVPEFSAAVSLAFTEGHGVFSGRVGLPAASFHSPQAQASLDRAAGRFKVQAGPERVAVEEGSFEAATLTLETAAAGPVALNSPRLGIAGSYDRAGRLLDLSHWELAASGLVEARGRARITPGPPYALEVSGIEADLWPEQWVAPALRAAGVKDLPLTLAGAVGVSGDLTLRDTGRGWGAEGRLSAAFRQNRVGITAGPMRITGLVSGSLQASGRAEAPVFAVTLSGRQVEVAGTALKAAPICRRGLRRGRLSGAGDPATRAPNSGRDPAGR